jgi:Sulfotransferase domain
MVSMGGVGCTMSTGEKRLPDAIIGGAPRSGTTFICEVLAKHPDVYVARPFIPEPKVCMTPHGDGDEGYRRRYASLFAGAPPQAVLVEKTSYYLENEQARRRLLRILPSAKYIFILREPVARAYSNWLWSTKNRLETLPFTEAVALEGKRASPLPAEREYARPFDYLSRGRYGSLARTWLEELERERVAFYVLEGVVADPDRFTADLQRFLGISELPWSRLATGRVNATDSDYDIDPALAARLREHFCAEVKLFSRLTGTDVSSWGY